MVGFDPRVSGRGVHGRGPDHCVNARQQRAAKRAGEVEEILSKASLYVEVTQVSIRRFDDEAHCRKMT